MTKVRKPRKPRAKALRASQPDYVRGPAKPLNLERDAAVNDLGADLTRLRALLRVIEGGLQGMPIDILTGDLTSCEVAGLANIAICFTDKLIEDSEKLSRAP
jgi:hypothetical protein